MLPAKDLKYTLSPSQITAVQLVNGPTVFVNIEEPIHITFVKPFDKPLQPYKIWEKGPATVSTFVSDEVATFITEFCDRLKKEFTYFEIKAIPSVLKTVAGKKNILNIKCREITPTIENLQDGDNIPCRMTVYFNPQEHKAGVFFHAILDNK